MIKCYISDHAGHFYYRIGDANQIATMAQITSIKGVPLAEIPTNTLSSSFVTGAKSTGENSNRSCSGGFAANCVEVMDNSPGASTIAVTSETDHVLDSHKTSMKHPECANLTNSISMPSILDDDLDEFILEEIDALCEQKSAIKAERLAPSGDILVGSQHNIHGTSDLSSISESVTRSDSVETEETLDFGSNLVTSQTVLSGNMPEEYMKYLESLNDRQREAACSDISIPLMIVAGPGSGKVTAYLSLSLSE